MFKNILSASLIALASVMAVTLQSESVRGDIILSKFSVNAGGSVGKTLGDSSGMTIGQSVVGCAQREMLQAMLGFWPSCPPFICDCRPGDANGDGSIDISDAIYIINYVFGGGPAPTPYAICSGDPNCDCAVDISDAVYLIQYIFGGGPAPCSCEGWLISCGPPLRK